MSTYRFTGKIGEGGMAEVFSAVQEDLERPVAIKMLKPWFVADPSFLARFQQEAKTLAAMHHEGLVRVIDLGKQDDRPYLVMERLQGRTLHERLHPKRDQPAAPLPEREAVLIAAHVLAALLYAHERHNVVHRDIKPANVFLCDETQGNQVKLMDFGIASILDGPRVTQVGEQFGTPEYMCPEQIQGKTPTPQWDLYGVGILLYEMVTGDVPFKAETPIAVAHKHLHERIPPLPATLSPQIRAVIEKALVKEPAFRFVSAREMLSALRGDIVLVQPAVVAAPIALPPIALPKSQTLPKIKPPGAVSTLVPNAKSVRRPKRRVNHNFTLVLVALFTFLSVSGVIAFMILRTSDIRSGSDKTKHKPASKTQASGKSTRNRSRSNARRRSVGKSSGQTTVQADPIDNKKETQSSEEDKQDTPETQDPKETKPSSEEPVNPGPQDPPSTGEESSNPKSQD
ncbi:MAG: serine/threonine protein kinase [Chthonomonadales bacterium]|nr:serine/threonine protein kinase [Chthonomonadales bacterium]